MLFIHIPARMRVKQRMSVFVCFLVEKRVYLDRDDNNWSLFQGFAAKLIFVNRWRAIKT